MKNEEKFYSIDFSANAKEYQDLASAHSAKGLMVVIENWVPFTNRAFGRSFTNAEFTYKFFQGDEFKNSADIGSCRIVSVSAHRTDNSQYDRDDIKAIFSDANGVLIKPDNSFGIRIDGIAKVVRFVLDVSIFGDYEKFLLHKENEELKNRIAELEKQLNDSV